MDLLRVLREDGWRLERQTGSHRQFRHESKKGTVTINGHEGDTLSHWLVTAILKQAGLSKKEPPMTDYLVVIEPAEDGTGFGAYVPDLPGCVATGSTCEEARARIAFSIPLHIESLRSHGEPVPPPRAVVERVAIKPHAAA